MLTVELRRRLRLTSILTLLVQRRLRWLGHADQGPSSSHTASHVAQTSWRPAEDMGYQDQGRPGTDLRTENLWPRTMEKGLGESV